MVVIFCCEYAQCCGDRALELAGGDLSAVHVMYDWHDLLGIVARTEERSKIDLE